MIFKMQNFHWFFLVAIPIMIGLLIYILFRSEDIFIVRILNDFSYFNEVRMISSNINIPDWILYSLPDGLWSFSFFNALIIVNDKIDIKYFILIILVTLGSEYLQKYNIISGTYDLMDCLMYVVSISISIFIFRRRGLKFQQN